MLFILFDSFWRTLATALVLASLSPPWGGSFSALAFFSCEGVIHSEPFVITLPPAPTAGACLTVRIDNCTFRDGLAIIFPSTFSPTSGEGSIAVGAQRLLVRILINRSVILSTNGSSRQRPPPALLFAGADVASDYLGGDTNSSLSLSSSSAFHQPFHSSAVASIIDRQPLFWLEVSIANTTVHAEATSAAAHPPESTIGEASAAEPRSGESVGGGGGSGTVFGVLFDALPPLAGASISIVGSSVTAVSTQFANVSDDCAGQCTSYNNTTAAAAAAIFGSDAYALAFDEVPLAGSAVRLTNNSFSAEVRGISGLAAAVVFNESPMGYGTNATITDCLLTASSGFLNESDGALSSSFLLLGGGGSVALWMDRSGVLNGSSLRLFNTVLSATADSHATGLCLRGTRTMMKKKKMGREGRR